MRTPTIAAIAALMLAACGGKTEAPAAPAASADAPAAAPAVLAPPPLPASYEAADLATGKDTFTKCKTCHSLNPADGNLIGPNLHGVFTRRPGTQAKFRYSKSMKKLTLEQWTPEELDKWLSNPQDYLPGSAMTFDGIADAEARRDLIAYLYKIT